MLAVVLTVTIVFMLVMSYVAMFPRRSDSKTALDIAEEHERDECPCRRPQD